MGHARQRMIAGIAVGAVATAAGMAAWSAWQALSGRSASPILTEERLASAAQLWGLKGPLDYDLVVDVSGDQTGTYHVSVRGGRPAGLTRNGTPLRSERTWFAWTVPGLFDAMAADLESQAASAGESGGQNLLLRATFDAALGYPLHYRRVALGSPGHQVDVRISELRPSSPPQGSKAPTDR